MSDHPQDAEHYLLSQLRESPKGRAE